MAVQAELYPETLYLPLSSSSAGLQDYWMINSNNTNHHNHNNNINPVSGFEPAESCLPFQEYSQHRNLFLQQQQSTQNFTGIYSSSPSSSSSQFSSCNSFISMALDANHLEIQRTEVDCILQSQNERLRSALQKLRKQQIGILLRNVESKAISLMRQKEEHLAQVKKKTVELEACLRKAQAERESWQKQAKEKEAMAIDLSNTLEQVKEKLLVFENNNNNEQDSESFCYGSCDKEKEKESSAMGLGCKWCNSRVSCMLFLPCRHVCSCKFCEAFLSSCPVCQSVKEGSFEVFWD